MMSTDFEEKQRQRNLEDLGKYQSYHVALSDKGYLLFLDDDGNIPNAEIGRAIAQAFARYHPPKWYIYLADQPMNCLYKIGISTDPQKRAYQLSLRLLHTIECKSKDIAVWSEMRVHANFIYLKKHIHLEWFELDNEDVERFKSWTTTNQLLDACVDNYSKVLGWFSDEPEDRQKTMSKYRKLIHQKNEERYSYYKVFYPKI